VPEWQLTLPDSFSGIEQSFPYVFARQIRVLAQNIVDRHPVCHHRNDRRNREPETPDARQAAHDIGVSGDSVEGHSPMLRARNDIHLARSVRLIKV